MTQRRALVVDDEHDVRFLLGMLLETAGLEVDLAENGEIALTKVEDTAYDVIVLDLMMPVVDGWGVLEALEGRDGLPPVLVLTAHASREERVRALGLGATAFMNKPFDPDLLADLVVALAGATPEQLAKRRRQEKEQATS